jgi:hypothetical protein
MWTVTRKVSTIVATAALGIAGLGASTSLLGGAAHASGVSWYEGKLVNSHLVLGPQATPSLVVRTPALPAGNYAVHSVVGMVTGTNDQTVCALSTSANPAGNDGVFGTTGNGSNASFGGSPVYGNAVMDDIVNVPAKGDTIQVWCNAFNYGHGSYAGSASIVAQHITAGVMD